jgi:hypothetical protein
VLLTGLACCRGWTEQHVGDCVVEQCNITAFVKAGRPRVPPARVFACCGELVPCVSLRGSSSIEAAPRSCGAPYPTLRPPHAGLTLVGDGNYSCERVVGGGDSSCKQLVGGEVETYRARRRFLVRGRDSLWGTETPRAGQKLLMRGGDWSCEAEACRGSHLLVGDEASCQ